MGPAVHPPLYPAPPYAKESLPQLHLRCTVCASKSSLAPPYRALPMRTLTSPAPYSPLWDHLPHSLHLCSFSDAHSGALALQSSLRHLPVSHLPRAPSSHRRHTVLSGTSHSPLCLCTLCPGMPVPRSPLGTFFPCASSPHRRYVVLSRTLPSLLFLCTTGPFDAFSGVVPLCVPRHPPFPSLPMQPSLPSPTMHL